MKTRKEITELQIGDIIKSSVGPLGSQTTAAVYGGKCIGTFDTEGEADHAIAAYLRANRWYPTIWIVSDHGNLTVDTEFYPK